jgi:hypothetical protein
MKHHKVRPMADIVINHRVGTVQGHGGTYNRFDGIPLSWDEHAVTSSTGGLVTYIYVFTHSNMHPTFLLLYLYVVYFRVIQTLGPFSMAFPISTILKILSERISQHGFSGYAIK